MVNLVPFVAAFLFLIMVFFDVKYKEIPSVLGTSVLFVLSVVNTNHLSYAVMMCFFALLLYEFGLFSGIADVKMIVAVGFLISSLFGVFSFVVVLTLYTAVYNVLMRLLLKVDGVYAGTVPIFLSYIVVWTNGGVV